MRWRTLRSIGSSPMVRAAAFFPLLGYWILFNDQVSAFFSMAAIEPAFPKSEALGILWQLKLYFAYFGLLNLGTGSLIYAVACPNEIKKHADEVDYIQKDIGAMTVAQMERMKDHLPDYPPLMVEQDQVKDLMFAYYGYLDLKDAYARFLTAYMFVTGIAVLAVPSALTVLRVMTKFKEVTHAPGM